MQGGAAASGDGLGGRRSVNAAAATDGHSCPGQLIVPTNAEGTAGNLGGVAVQPSTVRLAMTRPVGDSTPRLPKTCRRQKS